MHRTNSILIFLIYIVVLQVLMTIILRHSFVSKTAIKKGLPIMGRPCCFNFIYLQYHPLSPTNDNNRNNGIDNGVSHELLQIFQINN